MLAKVRTTRLLTKESFFKLFLECQELAKLEGVLGALGENWETVGALDRNWETVGAVVPVMVEMVSLIMQEVVIQMNREAGM